MKLSEVLEELNIEFSGKDFEIFSLETIKYANKNQITFFENTQYKDLLAATNAGAVILKEEFAKILPKDVFAIISENPYLDMAKISKYFVRKPFCTDKKHIVADSAEIASNVVIGNNSKIGDNVKIMPGVVIGANVTIEEGTIIYPNVVIYNDTIIGKNCIMQAGACIGCDGYGYAHTNIGEHIKIYHSGHVVLENDVEIGANTTIDRAVFGVTKIGAGTKIDNLVQIGHNCELGKACIIVSQTGLAGSTTLGRNVIMGGQSAAAGHLEIGDFATIAGRSGVTKSIEGGKTYGGFPLMLQKDWLKTQVRMYKFFNKKK